MSDCGCTPELIETRAQQRSLWIALALNAAMFGIEGAAGLIGRSTGLIADAFDMLADATAYAIALAAIARTDLFKARAAAFSGSILLVVGIGIVADVVRRAVFGSDPEGGLMMSISAAALAVNVYVLRLLAAQRSDEVHMRAAWIFTRADVVANAAVIMAGLGVILTGVPYFDLVVGGAIGIYVAKTALEILSEAKVAPRNG